MCINFNKNYIKNTYNNFFHVLAAFDTKILTDNFLFLFLSSLLSPTQNKNVFYFVR